AWPAFAAELGVAYSAGTYVLDVDPGFAAIVDALIAYDEPHAIVSDIPGYAGTGRAVRIDREGWVDARAVMAALDRELAALPNVAIIAGRARTMSARGHVELEDGRVVEGTHYLYATGATLTALLDVSDLRLQVPRVRFGIGTTLELAPVAGHSACLRGD